jgi:hypothetical protein
MKILAFSDSHKRTMRMIECIEEEMPDMLFHLGDMADDTIDLRSVFPEIPLICVRGNNDWGSALPEKEIVAVQGTRFFLTHGHRYRVRAATDQLAEAARAAGCQAALYGHTHEALLEEHADLTIANPGSITLPHGERPSYLRITIEPEQKPVFELVFVGQEEPRRFRQRFCRK